MQRRPTSVAHRTCAVALLLAMAGCGGGDASQFTGAEQAAAFQTSLRTCLARHGISYQSVVEEPGSVLTLVPAPAPDAWWASNGGFGLIEDQGAEVRLDPDWRDPNHSILDRTPLDRWTRILYGDGGGTEQFDADSCFDRALRAAGFFVESRAGSLRPPTRAEASRAAGDRAVVAAQQRRRRCLEQAGFADLALDPEGSLRRRFLQQGLITADGVRSDTAPGDELADARRIEARVAVADVRCRRSAGLDRAIDTALRRILAEEE